MSTDRSSPATGSHGTADDASLAAAPFDEWQFPPPPAMQADYERQVRVGYSRMTERRVVIAGLARNLESIMPRTIQRIEELGQRFADYRVVVYENDSTDRTPELLRSWARRNPRVLAVCEQLTDPVNPPTRCLSRAARMASYRSRCQQAIREHWSSFDHTILVDMDVQGGWSLDGVAHTFAQDSWDFVGSYGVIYRRHLASPNALVHYDAWAFRDDAQFTPLSTKEVNHRLYHRGQPLQPVTSCFGGLGIYRMPVYRHGRYGTTDTEHAGFHRELIRTGFPRLYLNPSQILVYGRRHRFGDPVVAAVRRAWESISGRPATPWVFGPGRRQPVTSPAPAPAAIQRRAV